MPPSPDDASPSSNDVQAGRLIIIIAAIKARIPNPVELPWQT
jgi:hypothetical protein